MAGRAHVAGSPPAVRLRAPGWRDPRLLLGIVLVAASVALGSTLVTSAGRTVPVYAAGQALVPGDALDAGALRVQQVRLGSAGDQYLRADEPLPEGLVLTRVVGAGELVPLAALAGETDLGSRPVAITPGGAPPSGLAAGSTVDLWFVPQVRGGTTAAAAGGADATTGATVGARTEGDAGTSRTAPAAATAPVLLAAGLTVAEVTEPRTGFGLGSGATVHVLVPSADLPDVLAALAADGTVEVVLVPGAHG